MPFFSSVRSLFAESARSLRHPQTVALAGVMLAAQIILSTYVSIQPIPNLRITLDHLAYVPTAMLFGPAVTCIQGALKDIIGCIVFPRGAYFPGFTISALLSGLFYGVALYGRKTTVPRIALLRLSVIVLINLLLNTVFLRMLNGPAAFADFPLRAFKNLIQWPIDCVLLFAACRLVERLPKSLAMR